MALKGIITVDFLELRAGKGRVIRETAGLVY
jgi:hypothetical protein